MRKAWVLWLAAFIVTLASAVHQRLTGPTYPKRGSTTIGGQKIDYRLIRSWGGESDAEVRLTVPGGTRGTLLYKRYKSNDEFQRAPMAQEGGELAGRLPHQPPAGKLVYRLLLEHGDGLQRERVWVGGEGIVIRFKGAVPGAVLIVHVLAMFGAMLWATRAGLETLAPQPDYSRLVPITLLLFTVGGMILGPVVQKYAFGAFWTGWPFGTDLTDNKTAVAWLLWVIAYLRQKRGRPAGRLVVGASIITLVVYLIPHSLFGSELEYRE